jgi:hypothetical protein
MRLIKSIELIQIFLLTIFSIFPGCSKEDTIDSFAAPGLETGIFPLSLSNGQIVTSKGNPFLIVGDSPWYLIQGPDKKGAEKYLENRRMKGINSMVMCLIASPLNGSDNAYGDFPFLTENDFSTPNGPYFDHAEFVISKAQEKGIAVFLYPAWLGFDDGNNHPEGWYTQVIANGPQKMFEYGKYIGARFGKYNNIIWVMGGDTPPKDASDEIRGMVSGIEESAGDQIFSVQNARYSSGITKYEQESWVDLNTTYADSRSAALHLSKDQKEDYPFYFTEGTYENTGASALSIRSQMYMPVLMGSHGYFYGHKPLYAFGPGWESLLESQGAKDLERSGRFFRSRSWYQLQPDYDHVVLTQGYGELSTGTYAPAAVMSDSSYAVIYIPDKRELTVNLKKISGDETQVWWYQPSTGKVTNGGKLIDSEETVLAPPGDGDWLLVLDDAMQKFKAPG